PGAGADHDHHRQLPGVRHRLGDHPGRSGRRLQGAADVHLRERLRPVPVRLRLGAVGGPAGHPHDHHLRAVPDEQCRSVGPELRERQMTTTAPTRGPAPTSPSAAERPTPGRPRKPFPWGKVVAWAVMIVFLFITLFPFYWMLRTALSSNNALATDPSSLLPVGLNSGGFERVFGLQDVETAIAQGGSGASINFWRYLLNSVIVATTITVVQTFSCAMAA